MATVDQLIPFSRLSDDSDGAVANIRSSSLEGSWRVPLSLVRMEVHDIVRLALTVSNPAAASTHGYPVADLSHEQDTSALQPIASDVAAISVSLNHPPTAAEATTLHEYRTLMTLGSVFALVKYWAFMRMLWRHDGESDRVVVSVIAHSENMKQPSPLRNAKNRKRWTIVRHGLSVMEILLNNRSLLLEVMRNRQLSFTNLICLRSDFLTPASLLSLVEKAQRLAINTGGHALSLSTLSSLCQQGGLSSAEETRARPLSSSSPASQGSHGKQEKSSSEQARSARGRGEASGAQPTKKRKRHINASSRERSKTIERRSSSASDSNEESAVENGGQQQQQQRIDKRSVQDAVQASSPQQRMETSSSLPDTPTPLPPLARLHAAHWRMASVPLLDYFYQLLEAYPQHLSVAAPLHYESVELYDQMVSHRLQEQCSTCTPLYDHNFLLRGSDRLRFLPAVSIGRDEQLSLNSPAPLPPRAAKVWVFVQGITLGDDGGLARVYQQLLDVDVSEVMRQGELPLIPAELLLQHGMHLLLVIQREGEVVASPSEADLLPVHCVHDVCAGTTLSATGVMCSQQHLIKTLQRRAAVCDVNADPADHILEMEQHDIGLPAGVFKSSPLPQPVVLTKPSAMALQRAAQMTGSGGQNVDFASADQLLYLLDQSLDDLARSRAVPSHQLLPALHELSRLPGLGDGPRQSILLALLTKAIALYALSITATPVGGACSTRLGCGILGTRDDSLAHMAAGQETMQVFRYSRPSSKPLLYVRAPQSHRTKQTDFGEEFHNVVFRRGEPCVYSTTLATSVVADAATTRAPCCASTADSADVVDGPLFTRTASPTRLSAHVIRSSQVISVDSIVPSGAGAASTLKAKLSALLPADLVDGGVLKWCQAVVHNPSYHLLAASELAVATHRIHSAISSIPDSKLGMGWYSYMVCQRPTVESSELVSLASVREPSKGSSIEELYGFCTELTSLAQAVDAVDELSQCLLSPFVSTTYGELDQAGVQKVIECMVENGLRADSLFLDIGCCYCKVLVHVAYATGVNVYGVEAVRERTERGRRCVQRWKATHPDSVQRIGGIEILTGDIIHNLHLLLPATHILLLDSAFMRSAREVLKHLWGRLAGSRLQMVFTCTTLEDVSDAVERVAQLQVKMGEDDIMLYAYKVISALSPSNVEVFTSPVHGLGLRAMRHFSVGETVLELRGERCSTYAKDDRWPWMIRHAEGWLHVENLARFVNWHDEQARVNVLVSADTDGTLCWQTTRDVRQGEELLSRASCWAFAAREELDSETALG